MSQPTSVILIVRKKQCVFLAKNKSDGLWTFPAVHGWDGSQESLNELAKSYFDPFIYEPKIGELALLATPKDKIEIDGSCPHCAIYSLSIRGEFRKDAEGSYWFAHKDALVPQVITPDLRCIIGHSEVQACL